MTKDEGRGEEGKRGRGEEGKRGRGEEDDFSLWPFLEIVVKMARSWSVSSRSAASLGSGTISLRTRSSSQ
jgi:hypothetical protein